MRQVLDNYIHTTGRHCGTASVSAVLRFHGHEISEAMVIGLAGGIDFFYGHSPQMSPSHFWGGRHFFLEKEFFDRVGVPGKVRQTTDPEKAWQWVKREIDAGRPALVQADIRWLDYYNTKTHFGGHKIVVVGYDDQRQTALISDSEFAALQEIPLADLARARSQTAMPWQLENDWFDMQASRALRPLSVTAPEAIAELAARMLSDRDMMGLGGMERAARDLPTWGEAPDWKWCARFGYQILEKRGTGGGNFRKLYAAFLEEIQQHCALVAEAGLAAKMALIGDAWTDLAYDLRAISELETPAGFDAAAVKLQHLVELEREFFETARGCAAAPPVTD